MSKGKKAGIILCASGLMLTIVLFMHKMKPDSLTANGEQKEAETSTEETEPSAAQEESETSVEKTESARDTEDDVAAVREMVRTIDFNVEQPHMELTEEEDLAYKEAFLRVLKNEIRIKGSREGDYFEDLWKSWPYEELLEWRDSDFPSYYYDDIDGDGKPEFGVNCGCVYFFHYEPGEEACSVSYGYESCYFEGLLGVGKLLEHDVLHAWVERFRYIVLNSDGEWETVLDLELYFAKDEEETIYTKYYDINGVTVEKEIWEELTAPFFEAIEHEIPKKTLTEVFGELLGR